MQKIDRQFISWIFEFAVVFAVFCYGGNLLDQKFGTSPNILFVAVVLGLWLEGWNLSKILKVKSNKEK